MTDTPLPEDVIALARSLYLTDDGKREARDWADVRERLEQINGRFRGGSELARNFIDHYFADLGAKPNVVAEGWPVFSFSAAMEAAMKEAQFMAELDAGSAGLHDAARVLLDWYAENVGEVTRGGVDRSAVPAKEDGTGLPPKFSAAEAWLAARLKEIGPDVSAGAVQTVVKKYR